MAHTLHDLVARDADLSGAPRASRPENLLWTVRVKARGTAILRGAMSVLPAHWAPWIYYGMNAAATILPRDARLRVDRIVGRLRARNDGIRHDYAAWTRLYEPTDQRARRSARIPITSPGGPPLISVIMPVFNPRPEDLQAAIQSVQDQSYPHWELCIADDASTDPRVADVLRQAEARDPRISVTRRPRNGHIAAASNSALQAATGAFVALLDHDDLLAPHALREVTSRIEAEPWVDILYSDEDKVDRHGRRYDPYFKPGWNPDLMLGQNVISHLGVYRRSLIERIGGFRPGLDGSQDYDLALRAVAATTQDHVAHIPKVLYHWRQQGDTPSFSETELPTCTAHGRRAVLDFVTRSSPGAQVVPAPRAPAWNRVLYPVPDPEPLVSVIIPTRNQAPMLEQTTTGLLQQTDYRALDVLIVDNGSDEPAALQLLERLAAEPRVRVLSAPGPFNYSALNNCAARQAHGSLILLLNNDISVIHADWLREMVSHAIRPEIGAVGAKLLYPNDTIQHGGVTLGMGGVAGHQYLLRPRHDPGYFGQLALARTVSAVTGACLLVRRSAFEEVGGLNEIDLPVAFNDIDFCMRVTDRGYRNVWTPFAELYHHESASRGSDRTREKAARFQREIDYMRRRWGARLDNDPYWNPNLSLNTTDLALAFPPRHPTTPGRLSA